MQLWVPADTAVNDEYMTAGKFLRIFDKVTAMIPLQHEAEPGWNTATKLSFRRFTMSKK